MHGRDTDDQLVGVGRERGIEDKTDQHGRRQFGDMAGQHRDQQRDEHVGDEAAR